MLKTIIAATVTTMLLSGAAFAGCKVGETSLDGKCQVLRPDHGRKVVLGTPAGKNTQRLVVQHKFAGDVAQYRCSIVNGQMVRHEGSTAGTGWCHD